MPKYKVEIEIPTQEYEIEADDEDTAYKIAFDNMIMGAMPDWKIEEIEDSEDE